MSALDWSQCPAVESSPEKVSGAGLPWNAHAGRYRL
jgi:hypothetical protein